MDRQFEDRPVNRGRAVVMTALLLGGAVTTWLVAILLMQLLVPLLLAEPVFTDDDIASLPQVVGGFALGGVASVGAVLLIGLACTWYAPGRVAGRVLLLVAGLLAIVGGLLLVNVGTFDIHWSSRSAVVGLIGAAAQVAVGLLAGAASLSSWLPGESLIQHMMPPGAAKPVTPTRKRMLLPAAALVVGWIVCTGAVLTRSDLLIVGFFGAQWGMPILAGAVVAGWREGQPNRLKTLSLAAAAGTAMDWLFLLAVAVGYYRFNPAGFAVWWAVMGALFGALGYSLWGPLTRYGARLRLRPR